MAKRITQTIQREIVDVTTGESVKVDSQKTFTEKINPERFYMTFLDYITPLYKLRSEVARRILDWMCEHAGFNTGVIVLSASERKQMCEDLDLNNNQITNNLKKLKELELISGSNGTFTLNPAIFWKGMLRLEVKFQKGSLLRYLTRSFNPRGGLLFVFQNFKKKISPLVSIVIVSIEVSIVRQSFLLQPQSFLPPPSVIFY